MDEQEIQVPITTEEEEREDPKSIALDGKIFLKYKTYLFIYYLLFI